MKLLDDISSTTSDWHNAFASLLENWQEKTVVTVFVTSAFGSASKMLGSSREAFMSLWTLVLIDLFTKWLSIIYCLKIERETTWLAAIKIAFKERHLNADAMRNKFLPKCINYAAAVAVFHYIANTAGGVSVFGLEVGNLATVGPLFIYMYLGLTEAISILENLIVCGAPAWMIQLKNFLVRRRNNLVGASETNDPHNIPPGKFYNQETDGKPKEGTH